MDLKCCDPKLATVNERLRDFHDSEELMKFYRKRITDLEAEIDAVTSRFNDQLKIIDYQHELENEIQQQAEEMASLKNSLSELQVFLFQEREHVLQLYTKNDQLKIKILEDRHKILNLLKSGHHKCFECQQRRSGEKVNLRELSKSVIDNRINDDKIFGNVIDSDQSTDSLKLKLEAAEEQLTSHKKLASVEIASLTNELKVFQAEMEAEQKCNSKRNSTLALKLKNTQEMLLRNTQEFFEMKTKFRNKENDWANEMHKIIQLERNSQNFPFASQNQKKAINVKDNKQIERVQFLQKKLDQSERTSTIFRDKYTMLEERFQRMSIEKDANEKAFSIQIKKFQELVEITKKRYAELERRRNFEAEGFKSDVNNLKANLKIIERQVYKVLASYETNDQVQALKSLHENAAKYNHIGSELKNLKSKLYRVENDYLRV